MLKHDFIFDLFDFSSLQALYAEIQAVVIVTVQDLPEFEEKAAIESNDPSGGCDISHIPVFEMGDESNNEGLQ